MDAPATERKGGALTRRGFLGLLAGGAVVGVAAGYAINQRTASNNSTAADLTQMTVYSSTFGEAYALRASTGKIRWARPLITSAWLAVGSGGVYAANDDGRLSALDAATGAVGGVSKLAEMGIRAVVKGLISLTRQLTMASSTLRPAPDTPTRLTLRLDTSYGDIRPLAAHTTSPLSFTTG